MAVDDGDMQLTLRNRLVTLAVCATGSMSLAATGATYVRTAGSFLTDGFVPGLEIVGTGFGALNNAASVVLAVTALSMTVNRTLETEVAAGSRTLAAGLPLGRAWENSAFLDDSQEKLPVTGWPWVEEQFIPGPLEHWTVGDEGGTLSVEPQYVVHINVPEDTGIYAANAYRKALRQLFKPATKMTLTNGDTLRVRTDTGPYAGQLIQRKPGWAVSPITFPLWLLTIND